MGRILVVMCVLATAALIAAPAMAEQETPWTSVIAGYQADWSEPFDYNTNTVSLSSANTGGNWTGTASARLQLTRSAAPYDYSDEVLFTTPKAPNNQYADHALASPYMGVGGKIIFGGKLITIDGGGSSTTPFVDVDAYDSAGSLIFGLSLGRTTGQGWVKGKATTSGGTAFTSQLDFGGYTAIWGVLDTNTNVVDFFSEASSTPFGSLTLAGATTGVGKIHVQVTGLSTTTAATFFAYADNLTLGTFAVPEPSSLVAFATFGIGLLGLARRRRA